VNRNFDQGMGMGGRRAAPGADMPLPDTGEQIYISSLALVKMLKHSRSGIPFEVMGLMLGEIHDDYTINVSDVFSMPQTGTTVSVESVDPVY
jgi:26S proteasome regulatory subunit N11